MKEIRIMSVNGQLGYGFHEESFAAGLAKGPDIIGVDGGSSDAGAAFLGTGDAMTGYLAVKRDLSFALPAALERGVPLIIGSSATAGGDPHIQRDMEIIREIARERGLHFKIAVIHAEVPKDIVLNRLSEGNISPLGPHVGRLTEETVQKASRIVGQMGVTPFIRALDTGAQVVLAGRSCDTAIYAALPVKLGFDAALAFHAAKVIECGAYCCTPGDGSDCMFATLRENDFILEAINPKRNISPVSVAAHTLYEQGHPSTFYEPDGAVICDDCTFEQFENDPKRVRVSGTRFEPASGKWNIKLEGAVLEGYRTVSIAGVRDPYMIKHIENVERAVHDYVAGTMGRDGYVMRLRIYGKNAVMGELEYLPCTAHELGIVLEVVAGSQQLATSVCAVARAYLLHYPYPERRTTGGNIAIPFSPSDIPMGPVYRFGIYHLMEVDDPDELFPIEIVEV